jgi:hypothetical protein
MPAQLVVVARAAAEKPADKSKKAAEEEKKQSDQAARRAKPDKRKKKHAYPPYIKPPVYAPYVKPPVYPVYIKPQVGFRAAPVGALNVFGQKPLRMGHFADVATLLDEVHARKQLPGGSNTLFASVANLDDMHSPPVRDKLKKLPEQLTIVVHQGKRNG